MKLEIEKLTLGQLLVAHRQELGITTDEISAILRVKNSDIQALEQDNLHLITPNLYLIGFIKSYAKLIKIDEQTIKNKLQGLSLNQNIKKNKYELINLEQIKLSGSNKERLMSTVLIILILYLLLFLIRQFEPRGAVNTKSIINDLERIEQ